jgi:hypothetical protein
MYIMKKVVFIVLGILILAAAGYVFFFPKGPDLSQYDRLLNPAISQQSTQHMLVVEAKGDPNVSGVKALKLLYTTYYSLPGVSKKDMVAPRARWPIAEDTPKDQWLGMFALPVPTEVKALPTNLKNPDKLNIFIADWEYGTVAEILHKGPYDTEKETVQKLKSYIKQSGYTIVSEHEEEYLKGPGMFGPGNPKKYETIIRYRVMKLEDLMKL